jgi:hypothetical protein
LAMTRAERRAALDRLTTSVDESVRPAIDLARRPRVRRSLSLVGRSFGALILALFGFGVVMVTTMLRAEYVIAGLALLVLIPRVFDGWARRWRVVHFLVVTPVAVVVPVVALLGFDVLWSWARLARPSPGLGLVIAGIVVTGVADGYLRWVGTPPPRHHRIWAFGGALTALVLAVATGQDLSSLKLISTAVAIGAAIWIYLGQAAGPRIKHPLWWALLLVGITVVAAPLLVEAIQGGRTSSILLIAGAVIAALAGLYGLWLPRSSKRLRYARRAFGIAVVFGIAVPLLVLAFVRFAPGGPSTTREQRLALASATNPLPQIAVAHRPILLFDSGERFRTPLDIDRMLATGDVQLCPEGKGLLSDCRTVGSATDLRNGFGNLRFDSQQLEDANLPTTIYAHVVPDALHPGWTDIDYWWYLADNPANTAQGAMCGAGLVIPEITCFDHQSDWEGATVVLDERQQPAAVHYAAHDHVINVPWTVLQNATGGRALRPSATGRDVANHPLVFVARGTHAAYPLPCFSSTCSGASVFEDNRHDGRRAWPEVPCSNSGCVSAFPRTADGLHDASWNGFDGHWGSAVCIIGIYCARSAAPKAPGQQGRYQHPWCFDYTVVSDLAHPRAVRPLPPGCG